jgi:hypothetical protein
MVYGKVVEVASVAVMKKFERLQKVYRGAVYNR